MPDHPIDWTSYHAATQCRPPRELLRRTLGCFQAEGRPPGVAVDLGCGSGPDSLELLRRGWTVHAFDADANGLQMLQQAVPPDLAPRLHLHATAFGDLVVPPCDLVWAGYSLPFCPPAHWPRLWQSALAAIGPGGRIAGDLFGPRHAFAADGDVMVFDEATARDLFRGLRLEAFDVEDGVRPSGGQVVHWHAFGFAAARPAADACPPSPVPAVTLRAARPDDALCLSVLAMQVFLDTYATGGIRPSLAREVLGTYAQPAFARHLADPDTVIVVAEVDAHLVGFAQVTLRAAHELAPPDAPAELLRLYVQEPFTGRRLGTALLQRAESAARAAGARVLWLTPWVGNHRALAFYRRRGYQDHGLTWFSFEGESFENRVVARRLDGPDRLLSSPA